MSTQALRSSPKSAKPWSSGRVLSSAQREAKRQKDRITKRTKAQEQKDRFDDLEGRIKNLQNFIQAHLGSCSSLPSGAFPSDYSFDSSLVQLSGTSLPFRCGTSSIELPASSKDPPIALEPEAEVTAPVPQSFSDNLIDELNNGCTIPFSLSDYGTCTILQFSNQVFEKALQLDIVELCSNDQLNQDAIIRGVLEGWHTLEDRPYLCPLWSLLGQIDERIFMQSGILTRFAMLRMIHLMLLNAVHIHSFGSLPPWYRPRPTQLKFAHQAIADYFAWPGLRERLVLSNCELLSDRFFKYFASCFRLFWPYPICDAYRMDPANNLYHFSDIFDKHVGEIRMWTMNKEFFDIFPELYDDIALEAPSLDVPMTLTNEDLGNLGAANILCDVSS